MSEARPPMRRRPEGLTWVFAAAGIALIGTASVLPWAAMSMPVGVPSVPLYQATRAPAVNSYRIHIGQFPLGWLVVGLAIAGGATLFAEGIAGSWRIVRCALGCGIALLGVLHLGPYAGGAGAVVGGVVLALSGAKGPIREVDE